MYCLQVPFLSPTHPILKSMKKINVSSKWFAGERSTDPSMVEVHNHQPTRGVS